MKKLFLVLFGVVAFLVPILSASAAEQATVYDFRGKVDVLVPGGSWQPVQKGMIINPGTTISTGFNSTAVLKVAASTVTVQQLTRLRLDQLLQKQGKLTTAFSLPIGRVQAQVRSADGSPQDFQIRSPVATAAVRGTMFEFNGFKIEVTEGVVAFFNRLGQLAFVQQGQQSFTDGDNNPSNPENESMKNTTLPGTEGGSGGGSQGAATTGTVVVTWQ